MLFSNYLLRIQNTFYLNEVRIVDGIVNMPIIKGKVIPYRISSSDESLNIALAKYFSENNERKQIGYLLEKDESIFAYNLVSKSKSIVNYNEVCYGWNEKYGMMDTTGTSSGSHNSKFVIYKAVSELIEKNELLLFWYGKKCIGYVDYNLLKPTIIKKNSSLDSYENFIFITRNISNLYTCIVITFNKFNKILVSSGVCADLNLLNAVRGAIGEAIQLNSYFDKNGKINRYDFVNKEFSKNIYNRILEFTSEVKKIDLENDIYMEKDKNIVFEDWINDITIVFLNLSRNKNIGKTIRCCSTNLFNCVPLKSNISLSLNKDILKRYNIKIDNSLDCVVL